jgi:hypothetical protein
VAYRERDLMTADGIAVAGVEPQSGRELVTFRCGHVTLWSRRLNSAIRGLTMNIAKPRADCKLGSRPFRAVARLGCKAEPRADDHRGHNSISPTAINGRVRPYRNHDLVATGFHLGSRDEPPPNRTSAVPRDRDQLRDELNW